MPQYSEQDLKYAAEFREGVHREALAIIRRMRPDAKEVVDRHPVEDYFQEHWDYPGRWYTIVAIPKGYSSRKALVDALVRDTLAGSVPAKRQDTPDERDQAAKNAARQGQDRQRLGKQLDAKPSGYQEFFAVEADPNGRSSRAVGVDAEGRSVLECREASGFAAAYYVLTDAEYRRYARLALANGQITQEQYDKYLTTPPGQAVQEDDPFYTLIAGYPDCAADYCIVKGEGRYLGYASHRAALKTAWRDHFAVGEDGETWRGNPNLAIGKAIPVEALFSPDDSDGELTYRRAFLCPPHENGYTGEDFARVNAALFPNGTQALEAYRWTTDWSEYFDDGREWWGTLCLTVFDHSLGRFVVILASATD